MCINVCIHLSLDINIAGTVKVKVGLTVVAVESIPCILGHDVYLCISCTGLSNKVKGYLAVFKGYIGEYLLLKCSYDYGSLGIEVKSLIVIIVYAVLLCNITIGVNRCVTELTAVAVALLPYVTLCLGSSSVNNLEVIDSFISLGVFVNNSVSNSVTECLKVLEYLIVIIATCLAVCTGSKSGNDIVGDVYGCFAVECIGVIKKSKHVFNIAVCIEKVITCSLSFCPCEESVNLRLIICSISLSDIANDVGLIPLLNFCPCSVTVDSGANVCIPDVLRVTYACKKDSVLIFNDVLRNLSNGCVKLFNRKSSIVSTKPGVGKTDKLNNRFLNNLHTGSNACRALSCVGEVYSIGSDTIVSVYIGHLKGKLTVVKLEILLLFGNLCIVGSPLEHVKSGTDVKGNYLRGAVLFVCSFTEGEILQNLFVVLNAGKGLVSGGHCSLNLSYDITIYTIIRVLCACNLLSCFSVCRSNPVP